MMNMRASEEQPPTTASSTTDARTAPKRRSSLLRRILSSSSSRKSQRTVQTASVTSQDYDEEYDSSDDVTLTRSVTIICRLPSQVEIVSALHQEEQAFYQNRMPDEPQETLSSEDTLLNDDEAPPTTALEHHEVAVHCASHQEWELALDYLQAGLQLLQDNSDEDNTLSWSMLQLQAQVLGQMGRFTQSLDLYRNLLQRCHKDENKDAAELANLYYTCGRLSVRLGQYKEALQYYQRELKVTQSVVVQHAAIARIYHEMARVCKLGLGDSDQALEYYRQALELEGKLYKRAIAATRNCQHCTKTPCAQHRQAIEETRTNVLETRRCMGRIYFEQGNLERAVELSIRRF